MTLFSTSRHVRVRPWAVLLALLLASGATAEETEEASNRRNVLFIAVDDLRPELGCYGATYARSPYLDQLARESVVFSHHYVQVPTCGASRYALLTGRRPSCSGVTRSNAAFYQGPSALAADEQPGAQTLPELFRRSGYRTVSIGKISHTPDGRVFTYDGKGDGRHELPGAWNELATPFGPWKRGWGAFFAYAGGRHREDGEDHRDLMEFVAEKDEDLPDGLIARAAVEKLRELKKAGDPFFLGVGFYKPHLPFVATRRDWEAIDADAIPLPPPGKIDSPYWHSSGEFRQYRFPFEKERPLAPDSQRMAKRAYLACVRYVDRQVGKVLRELENLELTGETVVVVWGDHGWHLGEQQIWGKHSPFERALRSVLMIRAPELERPGRKSDALVETIDLYPTLVDLCHPRFTRTRWPLDGRSLAPILRGSRDSVRQVASSYWKDAVSVRSETHRLVAKRGRGDGDRPAPIELYDLSQDLDSMVNRIGAEQDVVRKLTDRILESSPSPTPSSSSAAPTPTPTSTPAPAPAPTPVGATAPKPAPALKTSPPPAARPNVLLILTDQQFADAMSCAIGTEHIRTPHMDSLAERGVRFSRAYAANPLCVPSRASMFSGRYNHETGIQTNTGRKIDPETFPCMGTIFRTAGYETGFFGKWHMPYRAEKPEEHGFEVVVQKSCRYDGSRAAEFIRKDRDRPFLAIASFLNPHNICEWSRGQKLPGGAVGEAPPAAECPPLKPNVDPPRNETDTLRHMRRAYQAHRLFPVGGFTNDKWRQYLWAYYRLVEKVDQRVGTVVAALRESGQEENTVVVFLSDHGECHGVHRWNQKTVFYDESARVPFIISQKGTTPRGVCDALVQTGVDLLPTICDFAGIEKPTGLPGRSLRPFALDPGAEDDRLFIVGSNHMVQCEPVDGIHWRPEGRMVRGQRYKYCLYSEGTRRESLVDMVADSREMLNLAEAPEHLAALLRHREYLREFARQHGDAVALSMLEAVEAEDSEE